MPHTIHRWLTDLEHTACGLRRPHAVRGWREVTCQRCLGSIHAKLAQWQRQQPESHHEPQGHSRQSGGDPVTRIATPQEGGDASADVAGKAQRVTVEPVRAATNEPWL